MARGVHIHIGPVCAVSNADPEPRPCPTLMHMHLVILNLVHCLLHGSIGWYLAPTARSSSPLGPVPSQVQHLGLVQHLAQSTNRAPRL